MVSSGVEKIRHTRAQLHWAGVTRAAQLVLGAMAVVLVLTACREGDKIPEGSNLTPWGPATLLTVIDPKPETPTYRLSLAVLNFGIDADTAAVPSFDVSCTAVGTNVFGGDPQSNSLVNLNQEGLAVDPFDVVNVEFDFKWNPGGAITGTWRIDCEVDSANNVAEIVESDNTIAMVFDANCIGTRPCPGNAQQGTQPPS